MATGIGGDVSNPGQVAALYVELELASRARTRRPAMTPGQRAFGVFMASAGRRASMATVSDVREADFLMHVGHLDDRLAETVGAEEVLLAPERSALLEACSQFASAYRAGTEGAAHRRFEARLQELQAEVLGRLEPAAPG